MKIPFDIKYRPQIESGKYKVVTRSDKKVRIVCWDRIEVPIVALIGDDEDIMMYDSLGTTAQQMRLPSDLFVITPEPKLSEFELKVREILYSDKLECSASDPEPWKLVSSELLELARKELVPLFGTEYVSGYKDGFDDGKAEALKDLPRWEKYPHNAGEEPLVNGILQEDGSYKWRLYLNGYKIEISDLEKLPSFKEE